MPKAISYIRFSALHQGKGSTVDRQELMISEWLDKNKQYERSNLSRVDRGLSGYKAEHLADGAGLRAIQDAIRDGAIHRGDVLLVEAVDRLGRLDHFKMTELIGEILRAGVDIVTLEDNQRYDYARISTDGAWLLTGKIQQAHNYSDLLSNRIKRSYETRKNKAKEGESIKISKALWLDVNGKIKKEEAEMVRRAINLYKEGMGTRGIVASLQREFINTAPKDAKSITRWLTSRALLGEWQGCKVFDALLEHSEFLELQQLFQSRRLVGKPPENYFLSGLIKCGRCGKAFNIRRQKPKPTKDAPLGSSVHKNKPDILYANCRSYLKNDNCTNNTTWPLEVLQYIYSQTSSELLIGIAEGRAISIESSKELNELEAERVSLEQRIPRIEELYIDTGDERYKHQAAVHRQRMVKIKRRIEEIKPLISNKKKKIDYEETIKLQAAHHETTQNELDRICGDEKATKSLLMMYGYSIKIDGHQAYSPDSTWGETFVLNKRSQKYGCYIIEISTQELDNNKFAAISKSGLLTWENSEMDLILALEKQRVAVISD